mgnify:CR=1 FL=1
MITTVTLNPAIDRTVVVENFQFGSVNRVSRSREDIGGKGINVARIMLALGSEAVATGFMGTRNLGHTRNLLERDLIKYRFVDIDAETRQNTKLIDSSSNSTTDLNEPGFFITAQNLTDLKVLIDEFSANSNWIVFSGSTPPGVPDTIYRDLLGRLPGHCRGVLDADGALLRRGLEAGPYLIKPNIDELERSLSRQLSSKEAIVAAAREIIFQHDVSIVLVSMGGEGSILITADQALHAAALPVAVKNTVGAGDSMLAGMIHSLATGLAIRPALACATACGALAVSKEGTETISRCEAEKLTNKVKICVL